MKTLHYAVVLVCLRNVLLLFLLNTVASEKEQIYVASLTMYDAFQQQLPILTTVCSEGKPQLNVPKFYSLHKSDPNVSIRYVMGKDS